MMPKKETLFRDARNDRVCVLEDLDFYWAAAELRQIKKMWKQEVGVWDIAEHFDRDPDEVVLAIMHLAIEDRITARETGLRGN